MLVVSFISRRVEFTIPESSPICLLPLDQFYNSYISSLHMH